MKEIKQNIYNWNLEDILKSKKLDDLIEESNNLMDQIVKIHPIFFKTLNNFKKWLDIYEKLEIIQNRINNYISNKHNEDLSNPKWQAYSQKLLKKRMEFNIKVSNTTNLILDNQCTITKYLKTKDLKKYQRQFDLIFRTKKHRLSDEQEKIISNLSPIFSGWDDIFTILTDVSIKFKPALDSKNKSHLISNHSDVSKLLRSSDRKLRENAWINFNSAYFDFNETLTKTLYYNYLNLNLISKIYKHKSYIDATLFDDEINEQLLQTIYANVKNFKDIYKNYKETYKKILKNILNLDKLEPWDLSYPISGINKKVSIQEATKVIKESLKVLGQDYFNNINKALNENWISWLPNKSKVSGAYSIGGIKGLNKMYILMNYDYSYDSVCTLAHELGHSMHSLYTLKKQEIYTDYKIFYAEIPSNVNETLVLFNLIDKYKNDKKMKRYFLDQIISNFFNSTTRQIIFSNFEYEALKLIDQHEPFTKDSLINTYVRMLEKYEGINEKQKNRITKIKPYMFSSSLILRIPHFYIGNFYVYKYAIGQIVALLIAYKIYKKDNKTIERYFKFLQSGSSLSPIDTIKLLGIDLYKSKIYLEVKKIIKNLLLEFKKTI